MALATLLAGFESKAVTDAGEFEGYGSVFALVDQQRDVVQKGAFLDSLAAHEKSGTWPAMYWQHDARNPIGHWIDMREDQTGLFVKGQLWIDGKMPDPWSVKAHRSMLAPRGRMGLSIGFRTDKSRIDGKGVRHLEKVDLVEVSPVTVPANPEAGVVRVKMACEDIGTIRDFESFLRSDLGYSRRAAEMIARDGFKAWLATGARESGREPDDDDAAARDELSDVDSARIDAALAGLKSSLSLSSK